ncbi:MAG: helix-turn-helix transcriptional regulator [Prevotellaceae bacterium]|jgi:AraC-like DNA-binding protein|nr:helix-turn-helix transcriptional regulator [Prevotellaceae bacterium]
MRTAESVDSRLSDNFGKKKLFYVFNIDSSNRNVFDYYKTPQQLSDGGVFICLRGEVEFFLDMKSCRLKTGDMCVAFPFSILQVVNTGDDFEGFGMGAGMELLNDIRIPSLTDYYLYIKDNPCISLSGAEQKMLAELCEQMMLKYERIDHPFRIEIANSIFRIIYCEIAAIYKRGKPAVSEAVSRKDMLFRKFLFLISQNYLYHREVNHYACEMCVTPRYLSAIIKEKSGASAMKWINGMVIRKAKSLLIDNRLSVQQISDELNFANPSFFGQYFKKYTGTTPKKFRDSGG